MPLASVKNMAFRQKGLMSVEAGEVRGKLETIANIVEVGESDGGGQGGNGVKNIPALGWGKRRRQEYGRCGRGVSGWGGAAALSVQVQYGMRGAAAEYLVGLASWGCSR